MVEEALFYHTQGFAKYSTRRLGTTQSSRVRHFQISQWCQNILTGSTLSKPLEPHKLQRLNKISDVFRTCSNTSIVSVCSTATLTQDCMSTSLIVTSAPPSINALTDSVAPSAAAKKRGVRRSLSRGSTEAP